MTRAHYLLRLRAALALLLRLGDHENAVLVRAAIARREGR